MIRITQLKLSYKHDGGQLLKKIASALKVSTEAIKHFEIIKRSIDARKNAANQHQIMFIYTVDVAVEDEKKCLSRLKDKNISLAVNKKYTFQSGGTKQMTHRPVIVGSGPAGLFCGLMLARAGYCPVIIERGEDVDARCQTVEKFWEEGILQKESNVQFGEGGAGTFSDGKLNTLVKDKTGRNRAVLETFA